MILKRDEVFISVCELLTPISADKYSIGTGMFVSFSTDYDSSSLWIVTANHVAKTTNENTIIIVATKEGKAKQLSLTMFGNMSNWKHHTFADISAFRIFPSADNDEFLRGRFFPFDHFNFTKIPVSRDYELTCIGFPNGLGAAGMFSPLTFRSFAASGFITMPRSDTKQNCDFFCLENPSVGGYSGGPVLDLGYSTNGVMTIKKEKTVCHGIMHGTMSDNTGGKIALVTPAYYLQDIIS